MGDVFDAFTASESQSYILTSYGDRHLYKLGREKCWEFISKLLPPMHGCFDDNGELQRVDRNVRFAAHVSDIRDAFGLCDDRETLKRMSNKEFNSQVVAHQEYYWFMGLIVDHKTIVYQDSELRFNPNHDPQNVRFTTADNNGTISHAVYGLISSLLLHTIKQSMLISEVEKNLSKNIEPENLSCVTKGKHMTHEEADTGSVNPQYDPNQNTHGNPYAENCQTCTAVYELRRRGYDVEAIGFEDNIACETLAHDFAMIWNDPATGKSISINSG